MESPFPPGAEPARRAYLADLAFSALEGAALRGVRDYPFARPVSLEEIARKEYALDPALYLTK